MTVWKLSLPTLPTEDLKEITQTILDKLKENKFVVSGVKIEVYRNTCLIRGELEKEE